MESMGNLKPNSDEIRNFPSFVLRYFLKLHDGCDGLLLLAEYL